MTWRISDAKPLTVLRSRYGDEIHLQGHQDEEIVYRIVAEFALGEQSYAVLQSERQGADDQVDIFRITHADSEPELESILDDDEWEDVFDVYDEMTFRFDDEG